MFEYIEPVAYGVSDMDEALRVFRDNLGLELSDRRIIEGSTTVEKVVFRCGPKLIELLRPINHPAHVNALFYHGSDKAGSLSLGHDTALYVALILAVFSILFGTRHIDVTERHE